MPLLHPHEIVVPTYKHRDYVKQTVLKFHCAAAEHRVLCEFVINYIYIFH